jgi:hypothetical protein
LIAAPPDVRGVEVLAPQRTTFSKNAAGEEAPAPNRRLSMQPGRFGITRRLSRTSPEPFR